MGKFSKFILIGLFVIFGTISGVQLVAQEEQDHKNAVEKSDDVYATREEFKKAVQEEVAKQMKRLGQGELVGLSKELLEKEEQLRLREIRLQKREEELEINQNDFNSRVGQFTKKQNEFLGCLDQQDKEVSNRINHMVDVVGGMRPQSAADVLSVQEPDISIRILGMLEAERVSKIFNLMDKEVSARLQKQYMNMKK